MKSRFIVVPEEKITFGDDGYALVKVGSDFADALEAIQRVREWHRDIDGRCYGCSEDADKPMEYPCTNIELLDGEQ